MSNQKGNHRMDNSYAPSGRGFGELSRSVSVGGFAARSDSEVQMRTTGGSPAEDKASIVCRSSTTIGRTN